MFDVQRPPRTPWLHISPFIVTCSILPSISSQPMTTDCKFVSLLFVAATNLKAYSPMPTSCWILVFISVWPLSLVLIVAAEEQQGGGCSAKRCGGLTISDPFWLTDLEAGRSCGSLDFEVRCVNESTTILRSSGFTGSTGFAIMDISYEHHSLRVVDVYKEQNLRVSTSCRFPRWNTSAKLAPPFKVNPANLNLIFYNCTKEVTRPHTVEMTCVNASNAFVAAGVRYDATGYYNGHVMEGCDAIILPVSGSLGQANASDYKRLIRDGFLLTWDSPPALRWFWYPPPSALVLSMIRMWRYVNRKFQPT